MMNWCQRMAVSQCPKLSNVLLQAEAAKLYHLSAIADKTFNSFKRFARTDGESLQKGAMQSAWSLHLFQVARWLQASSSPWTKEL